MQQGKCSKKDTEGSIREIYFIVPGEVVPKQRPRFTRSGHAYTPKRTTDYETKVKAHYLTEYPYGLAFENEPLEIVLNVYFKIPASFSKKKQDDLLIHSYPTKRPDSDNLLKSVCDALNGVAYTDDAQIVMATVNKIWSREAKAEITIRSVKK